MPKTRPNSSKPTPTIRTYTNHPVNHEKFRIGVVRDTFEKNDPFLNQNPLLGKVNPRGFDLPRSTTFTFGHKNIKKDGGVAEAMKHDLIFKPEIKESEMPRDFINLNKHAVQSGITSVKDQSQYRMIHDIRLLPEPTNNYGKPLVLPNDYTAGHSNRPSTPVDKLMKFKFQEKWLKDTISKQEKDYAWQLKQTTLQTGKAFENKSSVLRKNRTMKTEYYHPTGLKKEGTYLWKMRRFHDKDPRISTFRTDRALKSAYDRHNLHKMMA